MPRHDDVEIPSLTLDHDEVNERRAAQPNPKRRLNPPPARPTGSAVNTAVQHKKTSLAGVYFLLLLILLGAASAGYWLWQQNQMLLKELQYTKGEIQNLDHQLLAADVSANEQGSTLEETLNTHASEIRKLWGVSYDTNRKAIATNQENLSVFGKSLASLKESVSTQSKLIAVQGSAFNDIEAGYNQLVGSVGQFDTRIENQKTEIATLQQAIKANENALQINQAADSALKGRVEAQLTQMSSVTAELQALKQEFISMKAKVNALAASSSQQTPQASVSPELEKTLKEQQEAINSIDAFRAQVNSALNRLDSQLIQIQLQQQLTDEPL